MKIPTNVLIGTFVLLGIVLGTVALSFFVSRTTSTNTPTELPEDALPRDVLIVAVGDSLTAGYGLPLSEAYPALLERALRARGFPVTVVNAGVSGETTRGMLSRASFVRSQNPDIIILGSGGNDALRFIDLTETETNLTQALATFREGTTTPSILFLAFSAPENAGVSYKQGFDALYPKLAEEYQLSLVPFIVPEVFRNPERLLPDGIHPNREGYVYLVETFILPRITQILTERGVVPR